MSWSLSGTGKPSAVVAKLLKDVAGNTCAEPEQTIRAKVVATIVDTLAAYPADVPVTVSASGCQSVPSQLHPTVAVNQLRVEINPIWGFLS